MSTFSYLSLYTLSIIHIIKMSWHVLAGWSTKSKVHFFIFWEKRDTLNHCEKYDFASTILKKALFLQQTNTTNNFCTNLVLWPFKGILCNFFIFTLEQIIDLNKYCTYNKPIPKISHVKTLQNLCKMRYKTNKKVRNKTFYFSNVDCEAI